jgi:hypothetical protein
MAADGTPAVEPAEDCCEFRLEGAALLFVEVPTPFPLFLTSSESESELELPKILPPEES